MSQTEPTYRTPRWVKLLGIAAVVLLVLIGLALLSGGEHSPQRHAPPASVTQEHNGAAHP